jgi:hypothetical protein
MSRGRSLDRHNAQRGKIHAITSYDTPLKLDDDLFSLEIGQSLSQDTLFCTQTMRVPQCRPPPAGSHRLHRILSQRRRGCTDRHIEHQGLKRIMFSSSRTVSDRRDGGEESCLTRVRSRGVVHVSQCHRVSQHRTAPFSGLQAAACC